MAIVDHGRIVASGDPASLKRSLGRDRIDVTTERPDELLPMVRELTGVEPQQAPNRLSVFVDDADPVLPRLLPLTHQGAEIGVSHPTLEDVFVDITGRGRTEEPARMIGAVVAVVTRELIRFQRQRGRLFASLARPLLWLIVIGAGFEKLVPTQGTVSYKQFLLPGLYGMVILFSTMLSALATVHDREFGPIRMLLVAPVPRWIIVIAKTISSALLGMIQVVLLFPLIWILGLHPSLSALARAARARSRSVRWLSRASAW